LQHCERLKTQIFLQGIMKSTVKAAFTDGGSQLALRARQIDTMTLNTMVSVVLHLDVSNLSRFLWNSYHSLSSKISEVFEFARIWIML
jgi:hypothetical protein